MLGGKNTVQLFGGDDLSLVGLVVVNRVGQRFAIIQDGHLVLGCETYQHLCISQGIRGAFGLDLVDGLVKLQGQVFGKRARFLPGEDAHKIFFGREGAMKIHRTSRRFCKAVVEILDKFWQVGIRLGQAGNPVQTQLFGQAILQGLDRTLDPSLGLGGIGTDDLNIQLLHSASELGQVAVDACGRHIDPKNAVFVAVEGNWFAVLPEIAFRCLSVAEETLAFHKEQLHQLPGGIVNEYQQHTGWRSPFEPVMRRAIDLDQFSKAGAPFP